MSFNTRLWNVTLLLVLLGAVLAVGAQQHEFAKRGGSQPAPLDQQPTANFQTATFGLG